ncbi:MAG TPA: hypothetical protein VEA38_01630 [Terriglobales bacterium]|nr:hypothetical protein [Terriglobales bacterium]
MKRPKIAPPETWPRISGDLEISDDLVARRIIMRRELWDRIVAVSETLQARGIVASPTDVAAIALEAGVGEAERAVQA